MNRLKFMHVSQFCFTISVGLIALNYPMLHLGTETKGFLLFNKPVFL